LKVGFRFPGGEERDEAAGLRIWNGDGAVRLHAACESESGYALLLERSVPGTPLGQVLPEPEQDRVVAGLLRRLWAQPHAGYTFLPLAQSRNPGDAAGDPGGRSRPAIMTGHGAIRR
jgi:streptomycin 6-kinase